MHHVAEPTPAHALDLPKHEQGDAALAMHGSARMRWCAITAEATAAFVRASRFSAEERAQVEFAIRFAADFVLCRHTEDVQFEKLVPGALASVWVRELPEFVAAGYAALRGFYLFLAESGRIERKRGLYLSCYFQTLQELHGA
jgi:hypothetical protein